MRKILKGALIIVYFSGFRFYSSHAQCSVQQCDIGSTYVCVDSISPAIGNCLGSVTFSGTGTVYVQHELSPYYYVSGTTFVSGPGNYYVLSGGPSLCGIGNAAAFTIPQVACSLTASAVSTPVSAFGCSDGTLSVTGYTNSSYGYSVSFDGVDYAPGALSGQSITYSNMAAGTYNIYLRSCGCETVKTVTVGGPSCSVSITSTVTTVSGYGCNDASLAITGTSNSCYGYFGLNFNGNFMGYFYSGQSTTFNYLTPGVYLVEIESLPTGCTASETITVPDATCDLSINSLFATAATDAFCLNGFISTNITVNDCNGYDVSVWGANNSIYYGGLSNIPSGQSATISNLMAGDYLVGITGSSAGSCTTGLMPITVGCNNGITVNMRLFLQGYYTGAGIMQPVLNNQTVLNSLATETDSITVELHDPTTFALIDTKVAVLSTDGTVSASFTQPAGLYYIAIKHRNTIQTWSANPVSCSDVTLLYDFSLAVSQAMGDNQMQVEPGVWAFFTGDLNQDDFIDGNDFPAFDTDSFNGVNSVYVATDMNGDGFVDGNDFPVFDVNSFNGVSAVHP